MPSLPMAWKVRETDAQKLTAKVRDLGRLVKGGTPQALKRTAILFAQSARHATPQSKAFATVIPNPSRRKYQRDGTLPYLAIRYDKDGREVRIPVAKRRDEKAKITTRAAMKGAWNGVLRKLHAGGAGGQTQGENSGARFSEVVDRLRNDNPQLQVANQVRYARIVDEGGPRSRPYRVMATAGRKAIRALDREINRVAAQMGKAWAR